MTFISIVSLANYMLDLRCGPHYYCKCLHIPVPNESPLTRLLFDCITKIKNHWLKRQIQGLAKQLDWTQRQVERWIRLKSAQHRPTVLSKFTESAWRCSFYFVSFVYGCYVLWDKPWMWDSMFCFIDYPHHVINRLIWFLCSSLMTVPFLFAEGFEWRMVLL